MKLDPLVLTHRAFDALLNTNLTLGAHLKRIKAGLPASHRRAEEKMIGTVARPMYDHCTTALGVSGTGRWLKHRPIPDRGHFVSTHDARSGYSNPNNLDSSAVAPKCVSASSPREAP